MRTDPPRAEAEVNALQACVQLDATTSEVRVTAVGVSVQVRDTTSYGYDANGDGDTKTGGWDYDWDFENLMTVAKQNGAQQQQTYKYDGLGRRVKVEGTSSSTWTVSIVSGMDVVYEKDNANAVTKYVYANGIRVAKITSSGAVQDYLGDHLGSTRQVRDSTRNLVFSAEYEPFGTRHKAKVAIPSLKPSTQDDEQAVRAG